MCDVTLPDCHLLGKDARPLTSTDKTRFLLIAPKAFPAIFFVYFIITIFHIKSMEIIIS